MFLLPSQKAIQLSNLSNQASKSIKHGDLTIASICQVGQILCIESRARARIHHIGNLLKNKWNMGFFLCPREQTQDFFRGEFTVKHRDLARKIFFSSARDRNIGLINDTGPVVIGEHELAWYMRDYGQPMSCWRDCKGLWALLRCRICSHTRIGYLTFLSKTAKRWLKVKANRSSESCVRWVVNDLCFGFVGMLVYNSMCIYVYIYIHVYMYVYIYINMYIHI